MKRFFAALVVLLALLGCGEEVSLTTQAVPSIRVSSELGGTPYINLAGQTVNGSQYIYVPNQTYLKSVAWAVDGKATDTDRAAPFDLSYNGGLSDTTKWTDGTHTIRARYNFVNGGRKWSESTTSTFTVQNTTPEPEPTRTLLFSDEFNDGVLDTQVWDYCFPWVNSNGCHNASNKSQAVYLPNNVTESNGYLNLTARRENVSIGGTNWQYTSGMVSTHPDDGGGFVHTYGYIEARVKSVAGQGFWPAFWNLPYPVAWPPEIDIFEMLGQTPNVLRMHYHYATNGGNVGQNYTAQDLVNSFHTYAVDWQPGRIVWYFDGVEVFRYENSNVSNKPMYLIFNFGVGGVWPGSVDSSTPFPTTMQVDYVRVYDRR